MAFTSSCPKCQKQVLVPDGTCPDAVVQCPVCSGEYSLSEILASAPPALIIVHSGSTVASLAGAAEAAAPLGGLSPPAVAAAVPPAASSTCGIFAAHRVEPTLHDAEPMSFAGDEIEFATPADYEAKSVGDQVEFAPTDHAAEPVGEEIEFAAPAVHAVEAIGEPSAEAAVPLSEEDHFLEAQPVAEAQAAEGDAPWVDGGWGGFKDEAAHEEDGAVGLAEHEGEGDGGLEHVDFAAITGRPAPGSGVAAGPGEAEVAEPLKKKKRKRESNPLIRIVGILFAGLLALPCVWGIAYMTGTKMDFLPKWLQPKPRAQSNAPVSGQTPAKTPTPTPANPTPPASATGNVAQTPPSSDPQSGSKPGTSDPGKATELAMNTPPKESTKSTASTVAKAGGLPDPFGEIADVQAGGKPPVRPAGAATGKADPLNKLNGDSSEDLTPSMPGLGKPGTSGADALAPPPTVTPVNGKKAEAKPAADAKPVVPAPDKPATAPAADADLFGSTPAPAAVHDKDNPDGKVAVKPDAKPDAKLDLPAPNKPATTPAPDADLFGPTAPPTGVNETGKPDAKPAAKPDAKADVPDPDKPAAPPATDADPFGPTAPATPVGEKSTPDAKPAVKPDVTPDAKPVAKPDVPDPDKPATPPATDADPFNPSMPATPAKEEHKPDAKPPIKPDVKPDVPAAVKPDAPIAPDKPATATIPPKLFDSKPDAGPPASGAIPSKLPDSKPDAGPVIGPEPKPDVKLDLKPEVKPVLKPEIKLESKPDVKPVVKPAGVGPLQAPSFPSADLDVSLKAVSSATAVDAKSYADWCKLAEVVTYVRDGADLQKQSVRTLAAKVAANPQAAAAIAAAAKKRFDDKATKGGIVLAGTVTGLGAMHGLFGTAVRMEGMGKPVMIFSAHPLGVQETRKVVVLGALVADPAKNLPGYPGKLPVVVWADLATMVP